ncbi:MAG: MBL fold metallo-hydrolase [Chloroflexi bacterium]|nr:MAG: MBL fold metallo-hydrolase [Chloroflexota bacterium]
MSLPTLLAPGVWRLPTLGGSLVNSFALEEPDGGVTLVDAGLRGATARLLRHLSAIGKRPDQVARIVVTHAHLDHVGDARRLRERTGGALCIHEGDATYCASGTAPPLDHPVARALGSVVGARIGGGPVDRTFADNELLPVAGGLRVLHTPGHTPGHCSLLHEPSGVLITGDAIFNWRNRMRYSFAVFCTNGRLSRETADRLGEVDYEVAAFTHGPEIRERARDQVRAFLRARSSS